MNRPGQSLVGAFVTYLMSLRGNQPMEKGAMPRRKAKKKNLKFYDIADRMISDYEIAIYQ